MFFERWVNLKSQEEKQIVEDLNDKVKINAGVINKQVSSRQCPNESITRGSKKDRW